jgi:phage gp46-like protein
VSDIALVWDNEAGAADIAVVANDLQADDGLETAVFLSLFTDRRAEDSDTLPDAAADRRGWWADGVPVVPDDKWGSRLWLLSRAKNEPGTAQRAREYAEEALAWLVEDRVTDRVAVAAEVTEAGLLVLDIAVYRPGQDVARYRYDYVWASQEARRVG